MIGLLLAMRMVCAPPVIHGNVPQPIIDRAVVVCKKQYNGCAVSITETGDLQYRVICKEYKFTNRIAEN